MRVTNVSEQECSLRGEAPTTLLTAGTPAGVRSTHAVNEESRERVTVIAPGEVAALRLDWSAPYCGPELTDQALLVELPHGGGTLRSTVRAPSPPACSSNETHPNLASVLAASAFDVLPTPTPADSTFDPVVVAVEPPVGRADADCRTRSTIPAGGSLRFEIKTDLPVDLSAERRLTVTWRLLARGLASGASHQGTFTVTVGRA